MIMPTIQLTESPIETCQFRGHTFFIKRDDLLHATFSGNKARKFYYFLKNDFDGINQLISYGSPQANSLYSFSALAKLKNWHFEFFVDHIPSYLKDNPRGNYRAALENGAKLIEVSHKLAGRSIESYLQSEILPNYTNAVFVPEGGRCQKAAYGVNLLADEIAAWAKENKFVNLNVALPSGTGTTALFLQKRFAQLHLPFKVLTCACVGGTEYLKQQFLELSSDEIFQPTIMEAKRKYHFGKLYDEFYEIWQALRKETNIEFELLYDPLGWITLIDYLNNTPEDSAPVIYIHQGGILGNETMQPRYERRLRQKNIN